MARGSRVRYVDEESCEAFAGTAGALAPVIYVIDSPEHPFDLAPAAGGRASAVVRLPVRSWGDSLTPWPARGLYREEPDFGGKASTTLAELCREAIPAIEREKGLSPRRRAICGYSLGGLFVLYAFARTEVFDACACLSGSVWYEGWVDYLRALDFDGAGRFAFLSIGSKEKRAAPKILQGVQDDMGQCAQILRDHGCEVEYVVGPGSHMSFYRERLDAGLGALDAFLSREA
ncbi:MAG: alpha/beta hydrolase [Olsenella sp.]|nr:alpha/beta hydrolase [Olsenella sp.]